jgi:glutathione S-transferase
VYAPAANFPGTLQWILIHYEDAGMLKIWGRINSVNVKKVVWAAQELGIPFERIDAGRQFGVVNTPEYLALNPNGKIPLIEDDGFVLWESNAIVRYLTAKHAYGTLYPDDLQSRADADRWMDWQATAFNATLSPAFHGLIRTAPEQRNPAAIEESRVKTAPLAAMLDQHLAGREYISGDRFTMADIVVGCTTHNWLNLPFQRPAMPHLERWYAALRARPASREVLQLPLS